MPARTAKKRVRSGDRLLNRELSSLDFTTRVLSLAADPAVPLLERVRFCALASQQLDDFFQVRVAGLMDQVASGVAGPAPGRRPPRAGPWGIKAPALPLAGAPAGTEAPALQ